MSDRSAAQDGAAATSPAVEKSPENEGAQAGETTVILQQQTQQRQFAETIAAMDHRIKIIEATHKQEVEQLQSGQQQALSQLEALRATHREDVERLQSENQQALDKADEQMLLQNSQLEASGSTLSKTGWCDLHC